MCFWHGLKSPVWKGKIIRPHPICYLVLADHTNAATALSLPWLKVREFKRRVDLKFSLIFYTVVAMMDRIRKIFMSIKRVKRPTQHTCVQMYLCWMKGQGMRKVCTETKIRQNIQQKGLRSKGVINLPCHNSFQIRVAWCKEKVVWWDLWAIFCCLVSVLAMLLTWGWKWCDGRPVITRTVLL